MLILPKRARSTSTTSSAKALERDFAGKQFRYLHVDEFQDINPAQYELIRRWMGTNGNLFAIGDPDQAIYSFRGAASNCFSRLADDYPESEIVRLKENYRSTPEVLSCAMHVISHNAGERALTPMLRSGAPCGSSNARPNCPKGYSSPKKSR